MKRDGYFRVGFDHFWNEHHFRGRWGINKNWLEPKTKPLWTNLTMLRLSKFGKHSYIVKSRGWKRWLCKKITCPIPKMRILKSWKTKKLYQQKHGSENDCPFPYSSCWRMFCVNFTNILWAAFLCESVFRSYLLFDHLSFCWKIFRAKTARWMFVKLTIGRHLLWANNRFSFREKLRTYVEHNFSCWVTFTVF